jgi:sugar O-acyltransferase (sialic acid O-acetyltransferase NeuD family)
MNLGIYCAGGFGKEIYDVALRDNEKNRKWDNIFFIDDDSKSFKDNSVCYLGKVYSLETVKTIFSLNNVEIVIASGEPAIRRKIYENTKILGFKFANVIDPSAIISSTAKLGEGVIITSNCIIASSAVIGNNVAINVKSIVGHDIKISNNVVLSSMVNIGGSCKIGESTYLGMGCLIKEGLKIGDQVIIGMGSVVHNDISSEMIALGNPARPMRRNVDKKVFK